MDGVLFLFVYLYIYLVIHTFIYPLEVVLVLYMSIFSYFVLLLQLRGKYGTYLFDSYNYYLSSYIKILHTTTNNNTNN